MAKEIIQHLLEDDDEESWKDLVSSADNAAYPADYGEALYLYDESGRVMASSRNLAGIRRYVSRMPVQSVHVHDLGRGEGGIKVIFANNWFWLGRFASFGVLKWSLRNWRNLYGATLFINGQPAGRISYRNSALQEDAEEDYALKDFIEYPWFGGGEPWQATVSERTGFDLKYKNQEVAHVAIASAEEAQKFVSELNRLQRVLPFRLLPGSDEWAQVLRWRKKARIKSGRYPSSSVQESDDDFEVKDLMGDVGEEEVTLEQMKAAEPNFFSRETNRFFGTKKLYKYGSYLVVKNVRRTPGYFGGTMMSTKFIVYRFMRTENSPQGVIVYQQEAPDLQSAKAMIKTQDFRPWREQLRARYGLPESEDEDDLKDMLDGELAVTPMLQGELSRGPWQRAGRWIWVFKINDHSEIMVQQVGEDKWQLNLSFDQRSLQHFVGTEAEVYQRLKNMGFIEGGAYYQRELPESEEDDFEVKDLLPDSPWSFKVRRVRGTPFRAEIFYRNRSLGYYSYFETKQAFDAFVESVSQREHLFPFDPEKYEISHHGFMSWVVANPHNSGLRETAEDDDFSSKEVWSGPWVIKAEKLGRGKMIRGEVYFNAKPMGIFCYFNDLAELRSFELGINQLEEVYPYNPRRYAHAGNEGIWRWYHMNKTRIGRGN